MLTIPDPILAAEVFVLKVADIFSISLQNALKYYFGNLHPSVVSASEGISGLTVIVGETIPTDYIKEEIY
jgi:hypothetical protein